MKNKKATTMPIKVIISAIIVLVVVALIIFAFREKINTTSTSLSSCELKQGECINPSATECEQIISGGDCSNETFVCCLKLT